MLAGSLWMMGFSTRLVRFALQRLYGELAWAYDAVSWLVSLGHWRAWTRVAARYVVGKRVLEVGCGTGHLLVTLKARGWRVCGCDPSPSMLRQARRRVDRSGGGVSLCRAAAQRLPFLGACFDTILCTFPSGYIVDPESWAEFARLLSPGGRVVVVYGATLAPKSPLHRLARALLSIGRVSGAAGEQRQAAEPPLAQQWGLQLERQVVEESGDRVGVWIAQEIDVTDAR